jgi:putative ABC transport system ATP-binding protein
MEHSSPNLLAVACRGVTKVFGQGESAVRALDGVTVNVRAGELTLLVGPSGCGKTTLISIMAGLLDPTEGTLSLFGTEQARLGCGGRLEYRRKNIGFVFQQYNLLPALTAAENVAVPLLIAGVARPKAVAKANDLLAQLGMENRLRSYPNQLSGGQQQRVAIARALIHEPRLLVCDEPTSALDAHSGQTTMELLKKMAVHPERAVIVVTHDSRVYRFGDRIISMSDGKIESVVNQPGAAHAEPVG